MKIFLLTMALLTGAVSGAWAKNPLWGGQAASPETQKPGEDPMPEDLPAAQAMIRALREQLKRPQIVVAPEQTRGNYIGNINGRDVYSGDLRAAPGTSAPNTSIPAPSVPPTVIPSAGEAPAKASKKELIRINPPAQPRQVQADQPLSPVATPKAEAKPSVKKAEKEKKTSEPTPAEEPKPKPVKHKKEKATAGTAADPAPKPQGGTQEAPQATKAPSPVPEPKKEAPKQEEKPQALKTPPPKEDMAEDARMRFEELAAKHTQKKAKTPLEAEPVKSIKKEPQPEKPARVSEAPSVFHFKKKGQVALATPRPGEEFKAWPKKGNGPVNVVPPGTVAIYGTTLNRPECPGGLAYDVGGGWVCGQGFNVDNPNVPRFVDAE